MHKFHHAAAHFHRTLMADTTAEYLEDLKRRTTRQAFMESVNEWKDADLPDVGVDAGVTSRKNFPKIQEEAFSAYTETIE